MKRVNLSSWNGSITDWVKLNYINQEAAKGVCMYLTKFWSITSTKNNFVVVLTIQNYDKTITPNSATFHYEIKKRSDGTIVASTKTKSRSYAITMSGEILEGFEDRDGFSYYALSLAFPTPSNYVDYTVNVTFELDGKTYELTTDGNISVEYSQEV